MSDENELETTWQRLITGQLKCRELPKTLDLPDIRNDMERLWQFTARDSSRRELGACIVLDQNRLKLEHEVVGIPRSVQPMHRVGDYDDHLGFFHTHPLYPDGTEAVGFSHKDFAGALVDDEKLLVVRSSQRVFALVRTERTRLPVPVSKQEVDEFFAVFQNYYDKELPQDKAQIRANHHLCCWLGFAFYAGEFGHPLKRELNPTFREKLMSFLRRTLMPSLIKG